MEIANIHKRMTEIENYKNENKIAREALKSELENNPEYLESCEEVKTTVEKSKRIKDQILAQQETQKIIADIKDNKEELDTLEEILSSELIEYHKVNNTDEIEDADGEPRRFKMTAKLQPKKKNWEDRDTEGRYAAKVELPNLPTNGAEIEASATNEPAMDSKNE